MQLKIIITGFFFLFVSTVYAQIIFETDFRNDAGYYKTRQGLHDYDNTPEGWDGVLATGDSKISVIANEGVDGVKPALKLEWDPNLGQPTIHLMKHLTGDPNTGYDELFIRYHVRLPNNFKVGGDPRGYNDNIVVPYWKWGRLWQNTGLRGSGWTENRVDSFYAVWNFGGSMIWGIDVGAAFGANTGDNLHKGSAGGERYSVDYYTGTGDFTQKDGHFQAMGGGAWEIDWENNPGFLLTRVNSEDQGWHTYELHIKLASYPTANDGIWEIWFNGIKQEHVKIEGCCDLGEVPGVPTSKHGSGFNMLVFFDNMSDWNSHWSRSDVDGFIWVNDVVVSTERIGHDYRVEQDETPPRKPSGLKLINYDR